MLSELDYDTKYFNMGFDYTMIEIMKEDREGKYSKHSIQLIRFYEISNNQEFLAAIAKEKGDYNKESSQLIISSVTSLTLDDIILILDIISPILIMY